MKRPPVIATIVVVAAMLTMIGLGVWQLRRADWKAGLLSQYAAAQGQPAIAYPAVPNPKAPPLFRRASAYCLQVTGWRAVSGRNRAGTPGWAHIASCSRGGGEGPGFQAVMGWSNTDRNPDWRGGPVSGVIAPDTKFVTRLVADDPAPGLQPSAPPALGDIPNNHFAYAMQWFFFAGVAGVIYVLALRAKKANGQAAKHKF